MANSSRKMWTHDFELLSIGTAKVKLLSTIYPCQQPVHLPEPL